MNRIQKVLTNYRYKRVSEYSEFAHDVATLLTSSTYLKDGAKLAAPVLDAVGKLDDFTEANPRSNNFVTAELNMLREAVMVALSDAANEVNRQLAGNEPGLLSTGFELVEPPRKRQPPVAPLKCEIVDGATSGSMCIRIKRAPATQNVKWYYTTDPSLPLEQWTQLLELTDELTLTGLTPGTLLHAKAACINSASTTANLVFAEARPRYVQ